MAKTKAKAKAKARARAKAKAKGKGKGKSTGKGTKPDNQDKECYVCGKEGHFARLLVTNKPRQNRTR